MVMRSLLIVLPFAALALSSCDKAKQAVEAAKTKMGGVADPGAPPSPGGDVASEFVGQVDSAAEGVRFRRDLPFPTTLKVRLIERNTFKNARLISTSELGKRIATSQGTWEEVGLMERDDRHLVIEIEKAGKVVDADELEEGEKEGGPAKPAPEEIPSLGSLAAGARLQYHLGADGWKVPESKGPVDFRSMVLEQAIRPSLTSLLTANGVTPRTQWFSSSRRWIGGDTIELSGETIALLFPGKGNSGRITLVYEAAEALEGHPCGRFSVEGDLVRKDAVGIDGVTSNSDISINSGKIWCSLIYPLVLREEYQMVLTSVEGSGNGPKIRVQGGVDVVVSRRWEP